MPNIVKPSGINQLWAAGGTKVAPSLQKLNIGWVVELPPYQYQNWLDNRQDTFIAHINQHGIPEWDTETEYQGNLSYTQGSNGLIYKCLVTNTNFNPTNPLNSTYWVRAFEAYGSVAVVQNALTAHLNNYATLAGIANPAAARTNLAVYSKTEGDVRYAFKGGTSGQVFSVGAATAPAHAVPLSQLTSLLVNATESTAGQIALATLGEVEAGTNDTKAITPLKGNTVYLKKSGNLLGLTNLPLARAQLGLADTATIGSSAFLFKNNNLGEFFGNAAVARANLGLTTVATRPEGYYLQSGNNLSDLTNVPLARAQLGLADTATIGSTAFLYASNNLGEFFGNSVQARANLGLGSAALFPSNTWLVTTSNLQDLTNVQSARNNLGLGGAATKNVFGIAGDMDFSFAGDGNGGSTRLGNGMTLQWGVGPFLGDDQGTIVALQVPGQIMSVQVTGIGQAAAGAGPCFLVDEYTTTNFRVYNNYNTGPSRSFTWTALVLVG